MIDFLEESLISINQKKSFHNNIPEKSYVSIKSANEKEFQTSENNDHALEKQISIENNKCLDSLALVPITESNSPSARDRSVAEKKTTNLCSEKLSSEGKSSPFFSQPRI